MAFDFPAPVDGSLYAPAGGPQYIFSDGKWRLTSNVNLGTVTAETRSRIVNGAFQISQEHAETGSSVNGSYIADQWGMNFAGPSGGAAKISTFVSKYGTPSRIYFNITTAKPALAAGDLVAFYQPIEGLRVADLQWGTAQAKQIVVRFTVRAPVAGNYTLSIRNAANDRSWLGSFNVPVINVDTEITLIVPGDTTGTWPNSNTAGMNLAVTYASGSTYLGAAGWQAGNKMGITGMANGASIIGQCHLADIGFYADFNNTGVAPQWQPPDYASELQACRRYFQAHGGDTLYEPIGIGQAYAATAAIITVTLVPPMRIPPAMGHNGGNYMLYNSGAAVLGVTTFAGSQISSRTATITATTSGLVPGNATILHTNNSMISRFYFNARM